MSGFLFRPYPIEDTPAKRLWRVCAISLFVAVFLLIFEPFELGSPELPNKRLVQMSYGLACFIVSTVAEFMARPLFSFWFEEKNWVVWKQVTWTTFSLFLIGVANLLTTHLWGLVPLNWQTFLTFQQFTGLVGIFPVVSLVWLNEYKLLHKNLKKAGELNHSIQHQPLVGPSEENVNLISESPKEVFTVKVSELLFVEASSNYVTVYYKSDGTISRKVLRSTLASTANLLPPEFFLRCHRSYIINIAKVKSVTGNAQGFKLLLEGMEEMVPVGRSYQNVCIDLIGNKRKS